MIFSCCLKSRLTKVRKGEKGSRGKGEKGSGPINGKGVIMEKGSGPIRKRVRPD